MTSVTRTNLAVQSSIWFIRRNAEQMLLCQQWRSPRAPAISHRAWASLGAGGAPLPGPWASREGRCRNPEVTGRGRRPILTGLPSRGPQLEPHGQKRCVNCGPRVFSGCRHNALRFKASGVSLQPRILRGTTGGAWRLCKAVRTLRMTLAWGINVVLHVWSYTHQTHSKYSPKSGPHVMTTWVYRLPHTHHLEEVDSVRGLGVGNLRNFPSLLS